MSSCKGLVGAIFGHKFSARFHIGASNLSSLKNCGPSYAVMLLEASSPKTYVHDVCQRCGASIRQAEGANQGAEGEKA